MPATARRLLMAATAAVISLSGAAAAAEAKPKPPQPIQCGNVWTTVPAPVAPSGSETWLTASDAKLTPSGPEVWTVGSYRYGPAFAQRWDGSKMVNYGVPLAPADVAVAGHNDVWVAGGVYSETGVNHEAPVVAHFDGTTWTTTRLPDASDLVG